MKNDKLSIILFSGTVDKIMAAVTLATGAAAMDKDVTIFLTFWGVMAFRKGDYISNTRFSTDFADYREPALELMQAKRVPNWMQTLKDAMDIGTVKVKACSMTLDLFDMSLSDLEPVVSEVTGVATFMEEAEGGMTLFI